MSSGDSSSESVSAAGQPVSTVVDEGEKGRYIIVGWFTTAPSPQLRHFKLNGDGVWEENGKAHRARWIPERPPRRGSSRGVTRLGCTDSAP